MDLIAHRINLYFAYIIASYGVVAFQGDFFNANNIFNEKISPNPSRKICLLLYNLRYKLDKRNVFSEEFFYNF